MSETFLLDKRISDLEQQVAELRRDLLKLLIDMEAKRYVTSGWIDTTGITGHTTIASTTDQWTWTVPAKAGK